MKFATLINYRIYYIEFINYRIYKQIRVIQRITVELLNKQEMSCSIEQAFIYTYIHVRYRLFSYIYQITYYVFVLNFTYWLRSGQVQNTRTKMVHGEFPLPVVASCRKLFYIIKTLFQPISDRHGSAFNQILYSPKDVISI